MTNTWRKLSVIGRNSQYFGYNWFWLSTFTVDSYGIHDGRLTGFRRDLV